MLSGLRINLVLLFLVAVVPATAAAAPWEWPETVSRLPPELVGAGAGALGVVALGMVALVLRRGRGQTPAEPPSLAATPSLDAARLSEKLAREMALLSEAVGRLAGSVADAPGPASAEPPDFRALLSGVARQVTRANRLLTSSKETRPDGEWLARADETIAVLEGLTEEAAGLEGLMATLCELSDRTQLLAINAAIEAAKAGESGRGLARVADDVRLMARDSRHSARRIERVMDGTVRSSRELRELMASGISLYRSALVSGRRMERRTGVATRLLTRVRIDLDNLEEGLQRPSGACEGGLNAPELAQVLAELHGVSRQLAELSERLSDSLRR